MHGRGNAMTRSKSAAFTWILLCCSLVWAASDSTPLQSMRLYVTNSRGDDISVIDLSSMKVISTIKVGERVHGVAVQADGRRLFATVESDHTLRIVDTATEQIIATIKLTGRPNQCAVTPNGKYVVVPIRDGGSADIVDVEQQKIVKVLPIQEPHNSLNIGSNRYIFISSMGSHEVDLIDLEKLDYEAHIPAGGRPRPFLVTSDGRTMYAAVSNLHGFDIVNIPEKKVLQRVELPTEHPQLKPREFETPDTFTHGIGLSPDESEVWVTSLFDDAVYIYDLIAKKVVAHMPTGDGPNWVAFSPDGKYACISNTDSDDVYIYDVKSRREVARVKVGKAPKRLLVVNVPVDGHKVEASGK
jgi:YVTN family beta-propeller protein